MECECYFPHSSKCLIVIAELVAVLSTIFSFEICCLCASNCMYSKQLNDYIIVCFSLISITSVSLFIFVSKQSGGCVDLNTLQKRTILPACVYQRMNKLAVCSPAVIVTFLLLSSCYQWCNSPQRRNVCGLCYLTASSLCSLFWRNAFVEVKSINCWRCIERKKEDDHAFEWKLNFHTSESVESLHQCLCRLSFCL